MFNGHIGSLIVKIRRGNTFICREKGEKRPRVDVWESRGLYLRGNQWVKRETTLITKTENFCVKSFDLGLKNLLISKQDRKNARITFSSRAP